MAQQRIEFVPSIHDGLRVTFGHGGPAGTLFFCKLRYWKVRGDDGVWRWPDRIVIESVGPRVSTCQECDLEFRSDRADVFCKPCEARMDHRRTATTSPMREGDNRPRVTYPKTFQEHSS